MTIPSISVTPSYSPRPASDVSAPHVVSVASETSVTDASVAAAGVSSPLRNENVVLQRVPGGFKMSENPQFPKEITFSGGGGKGFGYPGVCAALLASGAAKAADHFWGASAGAYTAACMAVTPRSEKLTQVTNAPENFFDKMNGKPDPNNPYRVVDDKFVNRPKLDKMMLAARLGSNGLPLMQDAQDLIIQEASLHIKQRLSRPGLSPVERRLLENTLSRMQRTPPEWTFGMLSDLHAVMPKEFKHLSISVTAVGPNGSRALICSSEDDRFRGVSILQIARASAAFPVAFARVDVPENFPIPLAPGTQLHDGGIMLNTPFRSLTDPNALHSAMPRNDYLVCRFNSNVDSNGSFLSSVVDTVAEARNAAAEDWVHDKLEQNPNLSRQTLTLDMHTASHDFSGATMELGMSRQSREQLQEHLRQQVDSHLKQLMQTPVSAEFSSAREALLQQPQTIVQQFTGHADPEIAEAAAAVTNFRAQLDDRIDQLCAAVRDHQGDLRQPLDLNQPDLRSALDDLDYLADDAAMQGAVAERMLKPRGNAPEVKRLVQALKLAPKNKINSTESVIREQAVTQDRQFLRSSIELHLYSGLHLTVDSLAYRPQPKTNVDQINRALSKIGSASDSLEVSAALLQLKHGYDYGAFQEGQERQFTDGLTQYAAESAILLRQERPSFWRDLLALADQDFSSGSAAGAAKLKAGHPFSKKHPRLGRFVSQELVELARKVEANRLKQA